MDWKLALLDLDGTLYRGETVIPGAPEFVSRLRARGVRPVFFTNNSTRTPEQVADKLLRMGISAEPEEVCTSAQAAASWLASRHPGGFVAYLGVDGLANALRKSGLEAVEVTAEPGSWQKAEAAVLGLDPEVTYRRLAGFCNLVLQRGGYVLTNGDLRLPDAKGYLPGNGAVSAFVQATTGIAPYCAGKPNVDFVQYALDRYDAVREEAVIIGDNPATDIALANHAGVYSILIRGSDYPSVGGVQTAASETWNSVAELMDRF